MKLFLQRVGAVLLGVIIALALLAVMFYLTGCGSTAETPSAAESAAPESTEDVPAEPESTAEVPAAEAENSSEADDDALIFTFETENLDGEPVSSEELFAGNTYTMINIWTSWCPYCIEEMPELEKMNRSFAEKGCGIIGVQFDAYEEEGLADGKATVAELGLTYPNIKVWKTWKNELGLSAVPTSFFVDSNGKLAGEPIVGARLDLYEKTLDELLGE